MPPWSTGRNGASTMTDEQTDVEPTPRIGRFSGPRLLSRVSIQSKLLVMLLLTSILSAAVVGAIGFHSGRTSLRASVFDRLTEIRGSQSRQLAGQVHRPRGCPDHPHPRDDNHRGHRGVHRRVQPTQHFNDQPCPMAIGRRLLQQPVPEDRTGADRGRHRRQRAAARFERAAVSSGLLHRSLH